MDTKKFSFVGPSCGTHASYTFYKAIKYKDKGGKSKILSLGEFFFVKIWSNSDIVAVGELQLIWEDKNANQILSSLRLYFLPEYTPEGRLHTHGEDEVVAVSEKAVLRVVDLLDWIARPSEVVWDRGLKGVHHPDAPSLSLGDHSLYPDFLSDIRQEKVSIGDLCAKDDLAVIIRSVPQYTRYRSLLKRIAGQEKAWISNSLVLALGGFTAPTRNTFVLFCREHFDYPELEEHPYLCNHLAPKLKGRPRKKKYSFKSPGSPESESASSESSLSTPVPVYKAEKSTSSKNGVKKDLVLILSQKNTKEELDFLKRLIRFMERRHTPIERPPMLGFKQIDLHLFFDKVSKLGGYEACMSKKLWKAVYDDIGGNPQNTSAATCTRRHYEKFLLPYEQYLKGQEDKKMSLNPKSSSDIVEDESVERDSASSPSNMDTKVDKSETLNNSLASSQKQQSSPNPEEYKNEDESENNAADTSIEDSQHEQQADSPTSEPPPALTNSAPAITNKNEMSESIPDEMDKKEAEEEENTRSSLSPQLMRNIKDSAGEIIPDVTITKQSVPKPSGSPLISQLNNMEQRMQSESPQMHIDPDGKRLQIDDLIIIPNNINAGTPEGGSALQNLAKIASRYQNQGGKKPDGMEYPMGMDEGPSLPLKRPKLSSDEGSAQHHPLPLPFSNGNNKKGGGLGASGMNSAAAASLFSLLPPNVLSTPWTSKTQTTTSNSPSKSLFSSFPGLADAMKLGADGYHLLQFYENQMKSAANALATNPSSGGKSLKDSFFNGRT
ncbi:AT-rich interactive domain-containing protein 5B [Lepeophtheirus salmonis]|uniref:AT-rich interactive domain-containing protein 5B n=1 Tax=Lepeophtheirus salmonis TaxID=72036 RepID=UPI001AE64BAF|nr:AT-rich interactive domain-containing protein 5B-like [Lepeophtheirus salmonis]